MLRSPNAKSERKGRSNCKDGGGDSGWAKVQNRGTGVESEQQKMEKV